MYCRYLDSVTPVFITLTGTASPYVLIDVMRELSTGKYANQTIPLDDKPTALEKAIFGLQQVGELVASQLPEGFVAAATHCGGQLMRFINEKIDTQRRRALLEMRRLPHLAVDHGGELLRAELNGFPGESKFTELISDIGHRLVDKIPSTALRLVNHPRDLDDLRGACRR